MTQSRDNIQFPEAGLLTNSPSKIRGGRGALTTPRVMNRPELKASRRALRTNGTPAEGALWNILKAKRVGGYQFRRQYSVGDHILDFYCPVLRLAIELDGDYHFHGNMPETDFDRDNELQQTYHVKTMRFENKIVFQQPETIVNAIIAYAAGGQRPPAPSNLRGGERAGGQRPLTPSNLRGGEYAGSQRPPAPSNLRGGVGVREDANNEE